MKRLLTVLALVSALFLRGAELLRIADATGSDGSAITALLLKLAAERPGLEVSMRRIDAEFAFEKFDAGDFDVVLVNGGDLPEARRKLAFRYAIRAYVAVVSVKNPLRSVSVKDLRLLVDTPRPKWELVGGPASDIHRICVVGRGGSPVGAKLLKLDPVAREMLPVSTMGEALMLAENDPAALVWGLFMPELPLSVVALEVDGASPSRANIRTGRYPLCVSRFAVGPAAPGGAEKAFLARLRTGEFAGLVEEDGEIPELPEPGK